MSNVNTPARALKNPIKGAGLTAPGIVILQTLFILLIETFEYAIGRIGTITGIALLIAICGGIYLGRKGTEYVNAVNPPLAFLFSTILVLCTLGGVGLHPARLGLDLITTLAAVAPYLLIGAAISWGYYFSQGRSTTSKRLVRAE
jgi:uncharacterized protein YneF (UPF0154 family)